ncbi:MAG TPA: RNB domain-containing ribonuclease [Syntrophales bacterium]|nr:RNB domain-containing ribonuclease [Syntrophales bacterium]HOX93322.1 RNB domain-containing ribonuclease [Syntrophales bacterium]HPI56523.1 RNB domain-containing ribonuclease [Syntrophales bacterium]HPN25056.1 RNB domain-containing ribonuclease [Syntrophales bacterium]HQM29201.1 RNB domain-containing ribonuclease [Syntrophales bacterium]
MQKHDGRHIEILQRIARRAMFDRGFLPDYSRKVMKELAELTVSPADAGGEVRDLRDLLWCSIDNDDSRDLDQLTVAEARADGTVEVRVAVADVDSMVPKDKAIDRHASHNTTSIYTFAEIFSMLPERLSTDLTSLNAGVDRLSVVVEMTVGVDGRCLGSNICRAVVRNHAKLAYNAVAPWLEGDGPVPEAVASVRGLDENLRIQDRAAQRLRALRFEHGALNLETVQSRPLFDRGEIRELGIDRKNRVKELIEDLMIAANGVTAGYLESVNFPSIRRVVHTPKRWERIVKLVSEYGYRLPDEPDSKALEQFLLLQRTADPLRFHDLSQMIIKLIGRGEYVAEYPGGKSEGHFGLAVKHYSHSTAPNRRFPDLVTQRLLKAAMDGSPAPYGRYELNDLARHCTEKEDDANKVERLVRKSAAALLLASRIGEQFDAVVTGAAPKGTWVRIFHQPIEGKLVEGFKGVDVGDRIRVQLIRTDVEKGFIDFRKVG